MVYLVICIDLCFFLNEVQVSLALEANARKNHDMRRELGSLDQKATLRNTAFFASRPNSVVLVVHWWVDVYNTFSSVKNTRLHAVTDSRRSSRLQRSSLFCFWRVHLEITSLKLQLVPFMHGIIKLYKIYAGCVKLCPQ